MEKIDENDNVGNDSSIIDVATRNKTGEATGKRNARREKLALLNVDDVSPRASRDVRATSWRSAASRRPATQESQLRRDEKYFRAIRAITSHIYVTYEL